MQTIDKITRLVVLDLDGTLLNDAQQISPDNRNAIRKAQEDGVIFALATGRPYPSVLPYANELDPGMPVICYNGALVRGKALHLHRPMDPHIAARVTSSLRTKGLGVRAYCEDIMLVSEIDEVTRDLCQRFYLECHGVADVVSYLNSLRETDTACWPSMLAITPYYQEIDSCLQDLQERFQGLITCHKPNNFALNIVSHGSTKVAALEYLTRYLGFERSQVAAIGNGDNDSDMLAWAGQGVAVANASPGAKAAADWVTVSDNNRSGVAEALEQLLK